jgi:hypothetical protein
MFAPPVAVQTGFQGQARSWLDSEGFFGDY